MHVYQSFKNKWVKRGPVFLATSYSRNSKNNSAALRTDNFLCRLRNHVFFLEIKNTLGFNILVRLSRPKSNTLRNNCCQKLDRSLSILRSFLRLQVVNCREKSPAGASKSVRFLCLVPVTSMR